MRYLSLAEILSLHTSIIEQSGGSAGLRDLGALESALGQPRQTFDGRDLYPSLVEKVVTLCFSLIQNHPFLDGNKRIGHASMEVMLVLNGFELTASVDDAEYAIMKVASGELSREELHDWASLRVLPLGGSTSGAPPTGDTP